MMIPRLIMLLVPVTLFAAQATKDIAQQAATIIEQAQQRRSWPTRIVKFWEARPDVTLTLPDGRILEAWASTDYTPVLRIDRTDPLREITAEEFRLLAQAELKP